MRKVEYKLMDVAIKMQKTNPELKELANIKQGYFHSWGSHIIADYEGKELQQTMAIIEDLETKKIHLVNPELVTFLD